jgi:hypothetical protein
MLMFEGIFHVACMRTQERFEIFSRVNDGTLTPVRPVNANGACEPTVTVSRCCMLPENPSHWMKSILLA